MRTSGSVDQSWRARLTGAASRGSIWKTAGVPTAATYTNSHPTRTCRVSMAPVCPGHVSAVGASAQLPQERIVRLVGRHGDPCGYDDGCVWAGDDGAEVEAGDFGEVVGEPRDPQQQVAQVLSSWGDVLGQLVCVGVGQRGEPGRVPRGRPGGAGVGAGGPERHQRPEGVVGGARDDPFGAARPGGAGVVAVGQRYPVAGQEAGRLSGGELAAVW